MSYDTKYDSGNVFAKILRGEIPCSKVYEDEHVLAFKDIRPQAKVHALVIPKGAYVSAQDFGEQASDKEIAAVQRAIAKVAKDLGVDKTGYRVIANSGAHSHQEVPHYHVHILGGQPMGKMVHLP
ncbi:MAG TPA: histidine triad nucleotide-binding protein [Dongiaceae bacterium]|jgi:diadenosine tetraphosphate (Ap4A) HIT family hydrolase